MANEMERDQESRKAILTEIDKNFFVEAGAGSGKTTMLVNRMVAMVEAGVDIRQICTITYTKAAAAEFYGRFRDLLRENSQEIHVPNASGTVHIVADSEKRYRCRNALKNIDLCFMGTIDSFCKMVLSEHPLEAKIPSDMVLMEDEEERRFLSAMYLDIVNGKYDDKVPNLSDDAKAFNRLHWNSDEVFCTAMPFLMRNRNAEFRLPEVSEELLEVRHEKYKELVMRLKNLDTSFQYHGNQSSTKAWKRIQDVTEEELDGDLTQRIRDIGTISKVNLSRDIDLETGYPELAEWFVQGRNAWKSEEDEFINIKNLLNNKRYRESLAFLLRCCDVAEEAIRESGRLTFFDTLLYLRNMLKESAENGGELIRYIRKRHQFFLVDEFQDTNPIQGEILFYLSSDTPAAKWKECEPEPGSLFMVGDPKQSIYRFGGADVASYLRVKNLFDTGDWGEALSLSQNFRSTVTLKKYFNERFSVCMGTERAEQRQFEEIPFADEEQNAKGCSQIWRYSCETRDREETIIRIIQSLVNQNQYAVVHKKGEEPSPITYGDIMVITKSKPALPSYVKALNKAGIPTWVEGGVPYKDSPLLLLAANLFSALADRENTAALYAVLTSRLCGFGDSQLMDYRTRNRIKLGTQSPDEDANDEITVALQELTDVSFEIRHLSPSAAFSYILDCFKILGTEEPKDLELLYDVMEQLRKAEMDRTVCSVAEGADFIQDLIWESVRERHMLFTPSNNCVHLANLHKVKGLEAPVVILAPADKNNSFKPSNRIERNEDGSAVAYWFHCKNTQKNFNFFETNAFSEKEQLEKDSEENERIRLEYVAATRARNILIVYGELDDEGRSRSNWAELLSKDLKCFEMDPRVTDPNKKEVMVSSLYGQYEDLHRSPAETGSYTIENPSRTKVSSKLNESETHETVEVDYDFCEEVHAYPTVWGTMVHRVMELLVSTGNAIQTDELISLVWNELSVMEIEEKKDDFTKALTNVCDTIKHGGYAQLNDCPQDILTELLSAEECLCEVPFCCEIGDVVWNGIMDVIYKKDGVWHIVDYKTDKDGENLDAVHRGQLEAYKQAFYATTGERAADAKIYHIAE